MAEIDIKLPYKLPSFHDWQPHATFYHPLYAGSIDGTDLFPHDRGVVRAMLSTSPGYEAEREKISHLYGSLQTAVMIDYKPNKNVSGDQSKTLFVARLSKDTNQDAIKNIFEKYGELEKCRLIRDFVTGFSRGYAFVEFKRKKDALNAARETHRMNVDGKQILVDFECERNLDGWKPRRFGGGFGGRKESGQLRFGGIDRPFRRPLPENVNHFDRRIQRESSVSSQDSRGDQGKMNKDNERYYGAHERGNDVYDKDRRSHGRDRDYRDRKDYKSNYREHRSENRDNEGHRGSRGHSKDRDDDYKGSKGHRKGNKDRDYRDKREYRDTQRDFRRHDRRDRDDYHRDRDDHYRDRDDRYRDRDDRYRDRKYRDKEGSRVTRDDVRSESSNSSRDPD